jgi:hypothetical protein
VRAPKSKLRLVKKVPEVRGPTSLFGTGDPILQSGIYRVHHSAHRLPHEVTVLQGQQFPRCAKCDEAVRFELIRPASAENAPNREQSRIYLYELPELTEEYSDGRILRRA